MCICRERERYVVYLDDQRSIPAAVAAVAAAAAAAVGLQCQ